MTNNINTKQNSRRNVRDPWTLILTSVLLTFSQYLVWTVCLLLSPMVTGCRVISGHVYHYFTCTKLAEHVQCWLPESEVVSLYPKGWTVVWSCLEKLCNDMLSPRAFILLSPQTSESLLNGYYCVCINTQ